ncbi:hypothetical protein BGZ61DRAFT_203694 [Ilyonectria robusta]|uniref:uncharacterized protein n=1 Tax=Ilyonectria robusta TaxID=1079257 RepID=UPI001E8D5FE7|nr:uncharacterized protein BGZ61DRAFT_203694 [Ilyonectria robusta]KAH8654681.1 hypothetical protein BGZ61DRAFT_203694 [Ilyonectria robusta]
MVGVTDLVADMGFIAGYIEAVPVKFQYPEIRPSSQEVAQLHELAAKILQHAETLQTKLANCVAGWTSEIYQKADKHMSCARPAIQAITQGQVKGPILKRNLVAIFQGRHASSIDSPNVRVRKERRTQKCETLRGLEPAVILAWGASLPPSTWEEMDRLVFNDLIKQVTEEAPTDLPPSVRETISALGKEEPLCSIAIYHNFIRGGLPVLIGREVEGIAEKTGETHIGIEELAGSPPEHQGSKRQRLDEDGSAQRQPVPDPASHGGDADPAWSASGPGPLPWVGAEPQELQLNDAQDCE